MDINPFEVPGKSGGQDEPHRTGPVTTVFTLPNPIGRLVAYLIDYFLSAVAGTLLVFLPLFLGVGLFVDPFADPEGHDAMLDAIVLPASIAMYFVMGLYFALFESSSLQATPGKLLFGFKVTNDDGTPPTFGRALGRGMAKVFLLALCGILSLVVLLDDERRGPWGSITKTRVVRPA